MILGKIIGIVFCCINFLCWTVAKYLLVNIKQGNHEDVTGMSGDETYQWKGLENNENISLSSRAGNCKKLDLICTFGRLRCG